AGMAMAFGVAQRRIAFQHHADLQRIGARLQQWVRFLRQAAFGDQGELGRVGMADGVGLPVLHFQHQQAAARVEHHEVGAALLEADRHVVPEQVVVFELLFQPFGHALLAAGHPWQAAVAGGYERGQWRPPVGSREVSGTGGYAQKDFARAESLCYHWSPMTHTARQYFWFYGYPKPLAEAWVRSS